MTPIETLRVMVRRGAGSIERAPGYREAVAQIHRSSIDEVDRGFLVELYWATRDLFTRNQVLTALVLRCEEQDLGDFFLAAIKREKMLHDLRLTAVRGYAAHATEAEVEPWMKRLSTSLAKIPEHTPAAFDTYTPLLSPFGLPYLADRYGYRCFVDTLAQVWSQYDAIPAEYARFRPTWRIGADGTLVDEPLDAPPR